jgi:hypothetical protein
MWVWVSSQRISRKPRIPATALTHPGVSGRGADRVPAAEADPDEPDPVTVHIRPVGQHADRKPGAGALRHTDFAHQVDALTAEDDSLAGHLRADPKSVMAGG